MIKERLDKLALSRPLGGGVVLTGGGAQLTGIAELANRILRLPVRVGVPIPVPTLGGLVQEYRNPVYATAVGLLLEGYDREMRNDPERGTENRQTEKSQSNFFTNFVAWLKEFN